MDINAALAALANNTQSKVVELRGEKGEKGSIGATGAPGRDAAPAQLKIGQVLTGKSDEDAQARIRKGDSENEFILDLLIPRGSEGPRGSQGFAKVEQGHQGPAGKDVKLAIGVVKSGDEASASIIEGSDGVSRLSLVLPRGTKGDCGREGPAGPPGAMGDKGESIVGPTGPPGFSVNEEMLRGIFIKIMSETGVLSDAHARLIAVRAELRRAVHEMDSRNICHVADVYRRVDTIIGARLPGETGEAGPVRL